MKIIVIGDKSYSVGDITAGTLIKTAKDAMSGQNAICALEKGNIIQMKKDTFPSTDALEKAVKKYVRKGFKVSYVTGGDRNGK